MSESTKDILGQAVSRGTDGLLKLPRMFSQGAFEACVLLALISIVSVCIDEYASRIDFSHMLEVRLSELDQQYAQAASASVGVLQAPGSSGDASLDKSAYWHQRAAIRQAQNELLTLERSGTLLFVGSLLGISQEFSNEMAKYGYGTPQPPYDPAINENGSNFYAQAHRVVFYVSFYVHSSSSDILLSLIAICCGGVGALIAGMRTKEFSALRDVLLGLSSGFVVYMTLRGGKYVLLMQQGEPKLNPYGFALAGILTGLFTDRAYGILTLLIDVAERNLKSAFGVGEPIPDRQKSDSGSDPKAAIVAETDPAAAAEKSGVITEPAA